MSNENIEIEFQDQEWGAILDEQTISENDFLLWNIEEKTLNDYLANTKEDDPQHFYNQWALTRTRNGCTLFWSFWAVSDLTWYKFTQKEILEIHDIAEAKYKWKEANWGWIYKWVDCVRDYWNAKNPSKELVSFRVDLKSSKDLDIIKKLYNAKKTLVIWYRTTIEHYRDSQDNWILDSKAFISTWAKQTWWHCVRYNHSQNIDNYEGRKKFNSYENNQLVWLAKEWTYFPSAYVYFYKEEFESIFKDVQEWAAFFNAIKWAKENGITKWYDDWTFRPSQSISRWEMIWMLKNFNDFLQKDVD